MSSDKAVSELIYRSCLLLNELNFAGYLELCASEFRYRITAWSPELRKEMLWHEVNREEMEKHLGLIPMHVHDNALLSRYPTVYSIAYIGDGKSATAVTGLQLFRTKQDGGESSLYGIGRYHDEIALESGIPRLLSREVRMTTRQLGTGSQIPL